jgi:integrase/recombinase XerC
MLLGGWRSRTMLDRYRKTVAADRAREAGRRLSLGNRRLLLLPLHALATYLS